MKLIRLLPLLTVFYSCSAQTNLPKLIINKNDNSLLWQVSGKNRTTFNQMINMDIEYSEQSSLLLDVKIISKTIPALMVQCYDQRVRSKKSQIVTTNAQVGKAVGSLNV